MASSQVAYFPPPPPPPAPAHGDIFEHPGPQWLLKIAAGIILFTILADVFVSCTFLNEFVPVRIRRTMRIACYGALGTVAVGGSILDSYLNTVATKTFDFAVFLALLELICSLPSVVFYMMRYPRFYGNMSFYPGAAVSFTRFCALVAIMLVGEKTKGELAFYTSQYSASFWVISSICAFFPDLYAAIRQEVNRIRAPQAAQLAAPRSGRHVESDVEMLLCDQMERMHL